MAKIVLLSFFSLLICVGAQAQLPDNTALAQLKHEQDSLQYLSETIFSGKNDESREKATDAFIPALVRALKTKYSFCFPFDSLKTISIIYPQDSSFRIFTWALQFENGLRRHYGAIQVNTADGQLKLFPLFDAANYITNTDTIVNNQSWYGCLYYNMIQKHYLNQEYYTLFGWDANHPRSQKKIVEILTFKNGEPVFGGPYFSFASDTLQPIRNRFIIEYKKESSATLNYNKELDMIVYDHLVSETNEPMKKFTYVSDMDYEGFKWQDGKWVYVSKIFHDAIPHGKGAPAPLPLEQQKKNMTHPKSAADYGELEEVRKPVKKKKP